MTELPEEVARELKELLRDEIPDYAVSIEQIVGGDEVGRTDTWWRQYLKKEMMAGRWDRAKRGRAFYYWPVKGA